MANEIYSKEVALEVDMGYPANPNWKLVICTISKSFNKSVATVTLNNDCNPDFVRELPTDASWNMSVEGNISKNPTANEVSSGDLQSMQDAKSIKPFRLRSLDGEYYREGMAFVNQLDETGSAGEYLTFSLGLTGTEPPRYEPEVLVSLDFTTDDPSFGTIGDVINFNLFVTNLTKRTLTVVFSIPENTSLGFPGFNTTIVLDPEEVDQVVGIPPFTTINGANHPFTVTATVSGTYVVTDSVTVTYTP